MNGTGATIPRKPPQSVLETNLTAPVSTAAAATAAASRNGVDGGKPLIAGGDVTDNDDVTNKTAEKPPSSPWDGEAYLRKVLAEGGPSGEKEKSEAEHWYDDLTPHHKSVIDAGIHAILHGGCVLAAQRSYDTLVRQRAASKRGVSNGDGGTDGRNNGTALAAGGEQKLASGVKFTPPPGTTAAVSSGGSAGGTSGAVAAATGAVANGEGGTSPAYMTTAGPTVNGGRDRSASRSYGGGGMSVRTNPMEPWKLTKIREDSIEQISPSTTSLMPAGLLDTLRKQEIFALLGWLAEQ